MTDKIAAKPMIADWLWLAALIMWLVASIAAFVLGQAGFFQRLGSFGVAIAVAYFAFVRLVSGVRVPPGYHERLHLLNAQQVENSKAIYQSLMNTSILAASLAHRDKIEGRETPESINSLARPIQEIVSSEIKPSDDWSDWVKQSIEAQSASESADGLIERAFKSSEVFQAAMIFLATLQWGFGDCLVNLSVCGAVECVR